MAKIGDLCETQGELTIEWKITDFLSLSEEKNIYYNSVRFYFCGASWELKLYPNGDEENNSNGWISLYLMRRSHGSPVTLNYTLGLKTVNKNTESNVNYTYTFHRRDSGYGCPKLISRSILLEKKSDIIPSKILTIICILKNREQNPVKGSLFNRIQDVSDNLTDIFKNAKRSDLILNTDGGNIKAHKMILETRSPVFAAMFSHDTKENQTGEIHINDVDKSTIEAILIQMYSGDMENFTTENVLKIYDTAEKYDIKDVKQMCIKFISLNLSDEWVCDIIKFSEMYQEEELGNIARNFFKKNAGKVLETENWKTFSKENHDLGVELLASVVKSLLPK